MSAPADWYPDPSDPTRLRYFDGNAWTEHTSPAAPPEPAPEPVNQWSGGGFNTPTGGFTPQPAQQHVSGVAAELKAWEAFKFATEKLNQNRSGVIGLGALYFAMEALVYVIQRLMGDLNTLDFFIGLVSIAITAGLFRAGLAATSGSERVSWKMMIETGNTWRFVGAWFFSSALVVLGLIACVIPGLILLPFVVYAPVIALEKGVNPFQAIGESFRLVRGHFWKVLWITTVCGLLYSVGFALFGVGVILTAPLAGMAFVYSYRALNDESVAA